MRLTVNLDDESAEILESLCEGGEDSPSKSQVIREALTLYNRLDGHWRETDIETLEWYVRFLSGQEHLILDIDHVDALFDAISDDEDFEEAVSLIGRQHGIQWEEEFSTLEEKLHVLEICNWYRVNELDSGEYVLNVPVPEMTGFVRTFLEAECRELGISAEFRELRRKVIVKRAE